jgi:DNA processing protein
MKELYIELSLIKGLGNKTIKNLLQFYGSPEEIFNQSFQNISSKFGTHIANLILKRDKKLKEKALKEIEKAQKLKVKIITINDENYPENLKEIPDPPAVLYAKGNLPVDKNSISFVGTRKYSSYGKYVAKKLINELSNVNIVSGLAIGIDTIAHETALKNGNPTTAVLGCGIDIVYPYENYKLYKKIEEEGTILSEFPIGTKPSKYTFPQRNRIVAGLSYGTVVIEAPKKSGSLITAKLANEYGRIVFAVPTNINNPYGEGNNKLLKEGAYPLTNSKDIYSQIPYLEKRDIFNLELELEISDLEKKILELTYEPVHIDYLVQNTGIPLNEMMLVLFDLEMKDLIINENGMYFRNI